jgi:hypothetical protein
MTCVAAVEPAVPGHWLRPLEGEAPKASGVFHASQRLRRL